MKAKEVLNLLQITRQTLCTYVKEGTVKVSSKIKNHYIYEDNSIYALIGKRRIKKDRKIISYSRVSTSSQKEQLKEQTKRIYDSCISKGLSLDMQFEDIKSGMSADRKAFQDILILITKGEVELLILENKDRLVRFGFEILERLFSYFGTKILILNDTLENRTYEQELTEDLISIIHYFTMKSYSHRRKLNKIRKEIEELKNEND